MNRRRDVLKKFYVDEEENEQIKKKMIEANKNNFSDYAREFLINGKVKVIDFESIKKLRYEVNRIGNNINQIVKLANENREVRGEDLEKILTLQHELEEIASKIIKNNLKGK